MLNEYVGTLNERGITLRWTDEAVANIAHRAAGGKSGARDIRNTIRRTVEDKIASLIVEKGEGNVTGYSRLPKRTARSTWSQFKAYQTANPRTALFIKSLCGDFCMRRK